MTAKRWKTAALIATLTAGLSLPAGAHPAGDFVSWLAGVKQEALGMGIRAETIDAAFKTTKPITKVVKFDRRQPEFTLTFEQYLEHMIPASIVRQGRAKLAENRTLLTQVSRKYGVPSRFLVAFWGIETRYGRFTGGFPVIDSLATLAYDGRRSAYFRKELFNALKILDAGHIAPEQMKGSWAGAMGQAQFMPSTFLSYASDFEGDGRIDIWNSRGDVFASAANYLAQIGWKGDQTWGREVRLPQGFDAKLAGLERKKPLAAWQALGVRRADGGDLPRADMSASLVIANDGQGPAFLVYDNFRRILNWNRSTNFALAVGLLADRIADR